MPNNISTETEKISVSIFPRSTPKSNGQLHIAANATNPPTHPREENRVTIAVIVNIAKMMPTMSELRELKPKYPSSSHTGG